MEYLRSSFVLVFFIPFLGCSPGTHAFSSIASILQSEITGSGTGLTTVPIWKQYVPVIKNNKTVAYKTTYYGRIFVGGPDPQNFTAVFDTGSGHFILPSVYCKSDTCMKHRRYNVTSSSTATEVNHLGTPIGEDQVETERIAIAFGTGQVVGEFVHDAVCLGEDTSLCMKLDIVTAVDMTSDPFSLFNFDGIIGLGLEAITLSPRLSFFRQLIEQNPRMSPQFSVFFALSDDEESTISFGGYDPERAQCEPQWSPVANPEMGYWQVQISTIRIGNKTLKECDDGSCRAVLDTGTSLLGIPRTMARSFHHHLARPVPREYSEDTQWDKLDCRTVPGEPLQFDLKGGMTVTLLPEDYSRPSTFVASARMDKSTPFCRALLLPLEFQEPLGPNVFIFGEPVLRRYYTVYDLQKKEIGFAQAKSQDMRSLQTRAMIDKSAALPSQSLVVGAPLPMAGQRTGFLSKADSP